MGKKGLNMASKESYDSLSNLPSINGVTLEGNLTTQQLNVDKHFKGWWPDLATLKAAITATAGDAAYVKDASPATTWSIYVYDSTASSDNYWADSGTDADTSNVQTFASGEEVNETYIDDTHLVNPKDSSLPTAADVLQLKAKLEGVTAEEIKVNAVVGTNVTTGAYVSGETGLLSTPGSSASSYAYFELAIPQGTKSIRFATGTKTSAAKIGYSIGHYEENVYVPTRYFYFDAAETTPPTGIVEKVIEVLEGETTFMATVAAISTYASITLNDFYCYLQSGESVSEMIESNKKEILDITTELKKSLNLLDPSTIQVGYRINEQGSAKINGSYTTSYGITDYIAIPPEGLICNHSVAYVATVVRGCAIYSNKNESSFVTVLNASENGNALSINPSGHDNWNYVRFSLYNSPTPYDGVTDGYAVYKGLTLPQSFQPYYTPYLIPKQQDFKSGEKIGDVSIVNDLTTGGTYDVASAETVKMINRKISEIDYTETSVELVLSGDGQNIFNGYISYKSNKVTVHTGQNKFLLANIENARKIRFLVGEKATNNSVVGYSIGTFSGEPNSSLEGWNPLKSGKYALSDEPRLVEYEVEVPQVEGVYAAITLWEAAGVTTNNFYCIMQSGSTLDDIINSKIGDVEEVEKPSTSVGNAGNYNIHAAKEHTFDDGTPPILEWFLVEEPMGEFYYTKDFQSKTHLFTFAYSRYYQFGILSNGDIIAVRLAGSLEESTPQSDAKRKNPYIWKADENWKTRYQVDFGEYDATNASDASDINNITGLKPCGWLSNKGFRILPDGSAMFGEYTRPTVETCNVWRIEGDALYAENWHVVKTFYPIGGDGFQGYKHVHHIGVDHYTGTVYCTTGDVDAYAQIWYTTDAGENWTQIPKKTSLNNGQQFRLCFMTFTKDYVLWATDTPGTSSTVKHVVYRGERDENGVLDSTTLEMLCDVYDGIGNFSSYGQAYLQEYNALFLFDRQDGGGTSSSVMPLYVVDVTSGVKTKVAEIKGFERNFGFRTKFKEWYPINGVIRVGFGFDTEYCNYIKVCGNQAFVTTSDRGKTTVNNLCIIVNKDGDSWSCRFSTYY